MFLTIRALLPSWFDGGLVIKGFPKVGVWLAAFFGVLISDLSSATPVDPSIGVCTRKDDFQKRQEALDPLVMQLSREKDDTTRAEIISTLSAAADKDIECLIRYREPALAPVFAEIVSKSPPWFIRTRALYAIKMLGETSVVPDVLRALEDENELVREAAANALGWLKCQESSAGLKKRLAAEENPYVRATIEASLQLLEGKIKPLTPPGNKPAWKEDFDGPEGARRVRWVWVNKGAPAFNVYDAKTLDYETAQRFVYPVLRYKEELFGGYPRNSFGGGGTHAGEDCAWFRDGCSIYAIADGLVRMVQGAGGDWGFLVVIEHRLTEYQYITSVYGHCAADVTVQPGEKVKAGQRIASQGLSCSVENGGYGAHLHFGLGHGPFRRPMGLAIGDSVNLAMPDGTHQSAPVISLAYSKTKENAAGWPALAAVVRLPNGNTCVSDMPEQQLQQEVSWLGAYVKGCRGWLNPQVLMPQLVEGSPPRPKAETPP